MPDWSIFLSLAFISKSHTTRRGRWVARTIHCVAEHRAYANTDKQRGKFTSLCW